MRRTDFCHLTYFVRAPAPRGLPGQSHGLALVLCRGIAWFTPGRLASAGRTFRFVSRGGRRCLPLATRADALLTPLSRPSPDARARALASCQGRQDRRPPARVKRSVWDERPGMPSVRQGPSPRSALSSARLRTSPAARLGHRAAGSRRLWTGGDPLGSAGWAPVHAPRCHRVRASLSLGDACRLLQPGYDARAHPNEPSILARERSSRPAARRHQPMPVALAFRCVTAPAPASRDLPGQVTGRNAREKATCVSRTMSRVPSS